MSPVLAVTPPVVTPELVGEIRPAYLVLADVTGYTRFLLANEPALQHSQLLINQLLEAVIREAQVPLVISKLEGDAVFLYVEEPADPQDSRELARVLSERLPRLFPAFARRLEQLRAVITCTCGACAHADRLRLKLIVHHGSTLFARVAGFDELLGPEVILAHRLLKNEVPEDEYLLLTEAAADRLSLGSHLPLRSARETCDGFGEVPVQVAVPSSASRPAPASAPAEPRRSSARGGRVDDTDPEQAIRHLSRRSFFWAGGAVAAAFGGLHWLNTRRTEDGLPWPLRRVLQSNEALGRDLFSTAQLAPEFPRHQVGELRVNGEEGLAGEVASDWKLRVEGIQDPQGRSDRTLSLPELQALPKIEMTTEFKCVEGWSTIVHWGGVRLRDLMAVASPRTRSGNPADLVRRPDDLPGYVGLETPDRGYYVGIDRESALHPQTLLAYEMNGAPLTSDHGAPLRLVTPVKYGYKNLKRIGRLWFTDTRPPDFWAERGYDYYAGH